MGRFMDWLNKPAQLPVVEHSSLASLVVSTQAQQLWRSQYRALAVAAVFRARQMNTDTLSSLPLIFKSGGTAPAPNDLQDTAGFVADTILAMQDHGEAFWKVFRNGDVRVLDNAKMEVEWSADESQRLYTYDGRRMRAWGIDPPLRVLAMNRGVADLHGFGPMQSGRIRGLIAEQNYSQEFFENNAQSTGNLKHPGVLTENEARDLLAAWNAGQERRGTGVLSGGLEYERTGFSPTDSEWTETHLVGVGDVATLFGVPATLLNYNQPGSSLTYQSIGDVYQSYYRMTLAPTYARRIEREMSSILNKPVHFDPEELFLASMMQRTNAAARLVMYGYDPAVSLDVVGLPPIPHSGRVPSTMLPEEET